MSGEGTVPEGHDQDADPPTPDGREPDVAPHATGPEPGSDPDPDPGAADPAEPGTD